MPDDFIPLAEESGLILPIGAWILERACQDARAWQTRHELPRLFISVNLSARQFGDPRPRRADHRGALAASGLDPSALVLEITESVLMQTGAATVARLTELRRLGIRLALDDFGTGYSSLSYLEQFPVDILKIDRSFVARMGEKGFRPVIARAVVQLGKGLGLDVVAEGIERPDQAVVLRRLGCSRWARATLYAEPLAADDVERLLHRGHVDDPRTTAHRARDPSRCGAGRATSPEALGQRAQSGRPCHRFATAGVQWLHPEDLPDHRRRRSALGRP